MEHQDRRALAHGLGAVAFWSTVATAFKVALQEMTPLQLLWVATLVSWIFLGVLAWVRDELTGNVGWSRALWAGLLNPTAYYLILFAAYERLPGQEAMALNYTWALTMSLLAVPLLGHRLTAVDVTAGLVAYAGVWTIATRGEVLSVKFADGLGVGLALLSTILWALYWIGNARDPRPPLRAQWQNFTVALPVLTLLMSYHDLWSWPGWKGMGAGLYVGLCEMGIAFVLWQTAVRTISRTSRVANLIFLSPPVSLLLLYLIVGEELRASTLVGLVLILTGLGLQNLTEKQRS